MIQVTFIYENKEIVKADNYKSGIEKKKKINVDTHILIQIDTQII